MIIATVGKNASGKDYFLDFISKEFGVPLLSIGDVVRELADIEGVEKTRENLHAVSQKYMSTYGQDFFPKKLIEKIKALGTDTVLVSGIRPPSDVETFKAAFGDDFFLVNRYVLHCTLPPCATTIIMAIRLSNSWTRFLSDLFSISSFSDL